MLKSSSSEAANYRAACLGKSTADFINKMKIVEEEADESLFWVEFSKEIGILKNDLELDKLIKEANELVAIFTQSLKNFKVVILKSYIVNHISYIVNHTRPYKIN